MVGISRRGLAGLLGSWPAASLAQTTTFPWPERTVRLVIPFAPGGGNDYVGRLLARHLSERYRQQVVVENRAGANGIIAMQAVLQAPADGYTLATVSQGVLDVNPAIYDRLPYDPARDFVPIAMMVRFPLFLITHPSVPVNTGAEFLAYVRQRPGEVSYSSGGVANGGHLAGVLFTSLTGTRMVHVPYRGTGPATLAVVTGEVQASFSAGGPTLFEHVRDGRLKLLGVAEAERIPHLPDIPTVAEAGVPGFEAASWLGIMARAGTPTAVVQRVGEDVQAFLRQPDIHASLSRDGFVVTPLAPEPFAAFIAGETAKWSSLAKSAGIRAD